MDKAFLIALTAAFLTSPAMAESRSVDLQPGFAAPPVGSPANPGAVSGYAVPMGPHGAQAGGNWTSRSGNTNVGGYVGGNTYGGYQGGVGIGFRY